KGRAVSCSFSLQLASSLLGGRLLQTNCLLGYPPALSLSTRRCLSVRAVSKILSPDATEDSTAEEETCPRQRGRAALLRSTRSRGSTSPSERRPTMASPRIATAMAFEPHYSLLYIGTKNGELRVYGQPGVEFSCYS
ncbi:hypothetical protein GBAR_LOCUS471, partial [Geodia barretti]